MPKNSFSVKLDTSQFDAGMMKMKGYVEQVEKEVSYEQANEILRLAVREVPHDLGTLQRSGDVNRLPDGSGHMTFFDTDYAAKMHENPQFDFQKGRKAKYLEDPIKKNKSLLDMTAQRVAKKRLAERLK